MSHRERMDLLRVWSIDFFQFKWIKSILRHPWSYIVVVKMDVIKQDRQLENVMGIIIL